MKNLFTILFLFSGVGLMAQQNITINFRAVANNAALTQCKIEVFDAKGLLKSSLTDESGKATLLIESYAQQATTLIFSKVGFVSDTLKNVVLKEGAWYATSLKQVPSESPEAKEARLKKEQEMADEKRKAEAASEKQKAEEQERLAKDQASEAKKMAKKAKKEAKAAKKQAKADAEAKKAAEKVAKDAAKLNAVLAKLDKKQAKLDERKARLNNKRDKALKKIEKGKKVDK